MAIDDQIKYVEQKSIDKVKWDACIDNATNGLVYGYSFYLDEMAKHWDALILNDYEAVMPLVWNKKIGLHYLYTPVFTSPTGVFGKNISVELVENFLAHIPKRFKLWDINLNADFTSTAESITIKKRINHVLSLQHDYNYLFQQFRTSYKQLIKKGIDDGCIIKKNISVDPILSHSIKKMLHHTSATKDDFSRFKKVFYEMQLRNKTITYGLYSAEGRLLASGIFFFSHNKAYYMLAGNSEEGRTTGASHQVINAFIKDHANENLILDFEGSDVPGIAFFFEGFGAMKEIYSYIHLNKLPFPFRFFKKK